jgi:hypothetical protein
MPFALRRITQAGSGEHDQLALTIAHDDLAAPRKGRVDFAAFRTGDYTPKALELAAHAWSTRALQEYYSLALFTQISSQLHVMGVPLDWCGAFARMIEDEVRHTDLCLRMCDALGRPASPVIDETELHLSSDRTLPNHVRDVVLSAFCIGETISGTMFRRAMKAATVPLAKEVIAAILVDETFHGEVGWELLALLLRGISVADRTVLVQRIPPLFAHYRKLCGAQKSQAWARAGQDAEPTPNFGTLTDTGYARAFWDSMEEDIVPALSALGLTEAESAYAALVSE